MWSKEQQPQNAPTTHCKAALKTLKAFIGKENIANEFITKLERSTATVFLGV